MEPRRPRLGAVALLLMGLIVFGPGLEAPFIFDDIHHLVANPVFQKLEFAQLFAYTPTRWLSYLTFPIQHELTGFWVVPFHVVNLLIHLASGLLLWALFRDLLAVVGVVRAEGAAWFGAAVFVVHPLQTQAVIYTWQRSTLLATFFYIIGLWAFLRMRLLWAEAPKRARRWWVGALVATVAAMCCKEIAVTLPMAQGVLEVLLLRGKPRPPWWWLASFGLCLAVIPSLILMHHGLYQAAFAQPPQGIGEVPTPQIYLITQWAVLGSYLRLIVAPLHQQVDYAFPLRTSLAAIWPFLLVPLALVGVAVATVCRNPLVSLAMAWFGLGLAVESCAFFMPDVIFEHRMYLPMLGVCLGGAWAASAVTRPLPRSALWLGALVIAGLMVVSSARVMLWRDPIRLWGQNLIHASGKARVWLGRAVAYEASGQREQALVDVNQAIRLDPDYRLPYVLRGRLLAAAGRTVEAVAAFDQALRLGTDADVLQSRGQCMARQGFPEKARADFEAALGLLAPDDPLRAVVRAELARLDKREVL